MKSPAWILLTLTLACCGHDNGRIDDPAGGVESDRQRLTTNEIAYRLSPSVVRIQTDTAAAPPENSYLSEFGSGLIIVFM